MRQGLLKGILRFFGTTSLSALVFVVAPHSWMSGIHASLGMGEMPDSPVVWYLARSTSFFYALLGGLFWFASFDLKAHRGLLLYLGSAIVVLGVALLATDWLEGLPFFWRVWEGPFAALLGATIFGLALKLPADRDLR